MSTDSVSVFIRKQKVYIWTVGGGGGVCVGGGGRGGGGAGRSINL